jgi:hypothetical protein
VVFRAKNGDKELFLVGGGDTIEPEDFKGLLIYFSIKLL